METLAVQAALAFAETMHKDQKYGDLPYVKHLTDVAEVLKRFKFDSETLRVGALLHDSVEDTSATLNQIELMFGKEVADLVGRVTNEQGKNRKERHAKTYPKIRASEDATTLKLADRIANVENCIELADPRLQMYKKEHPEFREMLYQAGAHDALWRHLDFLIGEQEQELK